MLCIHVGASVQRNTCRQAAVRFVPIGKITACAETETDSFVHIPMPKPLEI